LGDIVLLDIWGEHIFEKRNQNEIPTLLLLNLVHQPYANMY
jgi:hypothetical protein